MNKGIDNFATKNVVVFSVLLVIVTMPVAWGILYPLLIPLGMMWYNAIKYTVSAVLALVFMYVLWQKKVFSFRNPRFFKNLFTFGLLGVLGSVGAFFVSGGVVDLNPGLGLIIGCIWMNLAIAVSEEVIFRGILLNTMLSVWKHKKNVIFLAVVISNIIFGLRHLINLVLMPDTVVLTAAQVIFTFMAGVYLSAVFLRTNNIWVCVVIHFMEDLGVSIWEIFSSSQAAEANQDGSLWMAAGMILVQLPYLIFAILMLRDKKWDRLTDKTAFNY